MDKRDVKSLIISVVMFSLTFLANAYYGFFALLFSVPIFLLYGLTDKRFCLKSNLKDMGKYYLILLFISFFASSSDGALQRETSSTCSKNLLGDRIAPIIKYTLSSVLQQRLLLSFWLF